MNERLAESLRELNVALPSRERILIVDDEPDNLFVLEALLDDTWDVYTADDGLSALEVLEDEGEMDLIVTDQRMPGMTGVELLTRVAVLHPQTMRIVVTGYTDVEPMVEAINRGSIYRFMLKPWDGNDMKSAVREALDRKATAEAARRVVEARSRRNSELRTTLDDLEHTQRQVLAAERLSTLGRLTAGITHDIRNQANVMLLLVESVKMETDEAAVHVAAELALESLRALTSLVQDVNAFASDSGWALHRTPMDPRRFADETVGFLALEPAGRGREVQVHVDADLLELLVSPLSMRQGLLSLLRNAAQASPSAAPISLRVRRLPDGDACIEVEDRGDGMDEHEVLQALQPFYSAFDPPGLGLGLEIARLVVEAHGGRLELSSRRGHGTTGRLVIPTNPTVPLLEGEDC